MDNHSTNRPPRARRAPPPTPCATAGRPTCDLPVPNPATCRLFALTPLALAVGFCMAGVATAQDAPAAVAPLKLSPTLQAPAGRDAQAGPTVIRARELRGRAGVEAVAEGAAELRQGGLVVRADTLTYTQADDLAVARGQVQVSRDGSVYSGPELRLKVKQFEGFFLAPEFDLTRIGAGGRADRIDFIDSARTRATNAVYTSCPRDGAQDPAWLLSARSVSLDTDTNTGVAEGAVLRFMGVPILAGPTLSFPINDARKSGWLPPSIGIDNRSGVELAVPYYWNIAPDRDATIIPKVATRRGLGVDGEFRYLEPRFEGLVGLDLLPYDRTVDRSRYALRFRHLGSFGATGDHWQEGFYALRGVRVSDDDWWKDFPGSTSAFTPRLLPMRAEAERGFTFGAAQGVTYARLQRWQVLQSVDEITPPYERSPQVGARVRAQAVGGFEFALESEFNHFTLPGTEGTSERPTALRLHALGSVARPFREPGWWIEPRLSFNAAAYNLDQALADGRRSVSRVIPTGSVDAGLTLERDTTAFGRQLRQTLEPRLLYVYTPFREQVRNLAFDSAGKDFNFSSIFSENNFSGVDLVSDANQLTAGLTTRLVDPASGTEALRLGIVQRMLFSAQQFTPDGEILTRRFSDVLLLGSTSVIPKWTLDAQLRYNADTQRSERSILSARYTPGDFRTFGVGYRFTRDENEQVEFGWQWPIGRTGKASPGAAASSCSARWYSVGRASYSVTDRRVTDAVLGLEVDSGCWIGRIVAERLSTGQSEATTRLMLQLELVGLSRLGSNPLQVLKDNIPGYQMLREERTEPSRQTVYD
jgi:LPS-assembly protein